MSETLICNEKHIKKKSKKKKTVKLDDPVTSKAETKENDIQMDIDIVQNSKPCEDESDKRIKKHKKKEKKNKESALSEVEVTDGAKIKKRKKYDITEEVNSEEGPKTKKKKTSTKNPIAEKNQEIETNDETSFKSTNKAKKHEKVAGISEKCSESTNLNANETKHEDGDLKKKKKKKNKKSLPPLPDPEPGAFQAMLSVLPDSNSNVAKVPDEALEKIDDDVNENEDNQEPVRVKEKKKKREKVKDDHADEKKSTKNLALEYLLSWKQDKNHWSFKKIRQIWLLQHIYDEEAIPDENFAVLLEYLQGAKGAAKTKTIEEAEKFFNENINTSDECYKVKSKRAREIVQFLSV